jgi:GNAT superfamily N-acetyltransferase
MVSVDERPVTIRHDLRPGDLGRVTTMHGVLYAEEYGWDHTFEAYVAETLAEFGRALRPGQDRLWLAELDGQLIGSIGIVGRESGLAQLRWFLVHPDARGRGLGQRLVNDALAFCRTAGYRAVFLWTEARLTAAARRYMAAGFRMTDEREPQAMWGTTIVEQRYDLTLLPG